MAQIKDDAVTVDVRKHFSRRLRVAADAKIDAIKHEYNSLDEDYFNEHDAEERLTAQAFLDLIRAGKLTQADVNMEEIIAQCKEVIKNDWGFELTDLSKLFKVNVRTQVKAQITALKKQHKQRVSEQARRIAAINKEVERLEDNIYFGKGAAELRKALLDFTRKKF